MKAVIGIFLLLAALFGAWYFTQRVAPPVPAVVAVPSPQPVSPPPPANPEPAPVQYPIDQVVERAGPPPGPVEAPAPEREPPPALDASDGPVHDWLASAMSGPLLEWFADSGFIRRVVATVDNLPRERASVRLWPIATAKGLPRIAGEASTLQLTPENGQRYSGYVAIAEGVDIDALVAGYKRLYPLFQQAYRELGYPGGNFNDRLVAVIDHLLAAPEIEGPIALRQPKVVYQFADPALESMSAGQKIMVRIGPDNARRIKARLQVLRRRLAGQV